MFQSIKPVKPTLAPDRYSPLLLAEETDEVQAQNGGQETDTIPTAI